MKLLLNYYQVYEDLKQYYIENIQEINTKKDLYDFVDNNLYLIQKNVGNRVNEFLITERIDLNTTYLKDPNDSNIDKFLTNKENKKNIIKYTNTRDIRTKTIDETKGNIDEERKKDRKEEGEEDGVEGGFTYNKSKQKSNKKSKKSKQQLRINSSRKKY